MVDTNTYLVNLAGTLIIDKPYREKIETSVGYLRSKIWGLFQEKLLKITVIGSFDRDTIIPTDSNIDVDVLIVFKQNELQPDTYLKQLKDFCGKNYPKSEIYQDHPTIAVELDHIKFELIPSFYHFNGTVKIPAARSEKLTWITTTPDIFKEKVLAKDKGNKGLILPLIRIFKYWNLLNDKPFTSYEIESFIVAREYFSTSLKDYYFSVSNGIQGIAKTDKQKLAASDLKEKNRRIKGLEQINVPEYIENEFNSFLPYL